MFALAQIIQRLPHPGFAVCHGRASGFGGFRLLLRTQFGLTHATAENWSKSGVFMAYAAQRCAVVGKMKIELLLRFPLPSRLTRSARSAEAELDERADLLHEWYRQNADWTVIARKISGSDPCRQSGGGSEMIDPLVIISPELNPAQGGVGDHTLRSHRKMVQLRKRHGSGPPGRWTEAAVRPVRSRGSGSERAGHSRSASRRRQIISAIQRIRIRPARLSPTPDSSGR